MLLRNIAQVIAILGGLLTAGFAVYAARGAEAGSLPFLIIAIVWAVSPYAGLTVLARRAAGPRYWPAVLVISALLVLSFGLYFFWLGFFAHPDPQSGLLFIFLPFYQLAFVGALFFVGVLLRGGSQRPHQRIMRSASEGKEQPK